jgi:hypothetical protein
MKIKRTIHPILVLLAMVAMLLSCGKMDATYREFLKDGEYFYPGRADSLRAHPGDGRIQLSWLKAADPSVTTAKIYWNTRQDSAVIPLDRLAGSDTMRVIIENLEENSYTFEVFTQDGNGNISVRSEVLGEVYGDAYRGSLLHRAIQGISFSHENGSLTVAWAPAEETAIRDSITYKLANGEMRIQAVPVDEDTTLLRDYSPNDSFHQQSYFLPDSLAIDTFSTSVLTVDIDPALFLPPSAMLDKSNFAHIILPTDTYQPNSGTSTVERIWDGVSNKDDGTFISKVGTAMPQWFTFDLGATSKLTEMQINQRGLNGSRLYDGGNVKKAEIWGSVNPNPDGSWDDSWVSLATFESVKPSGSDATTEEDVTYALAGEKVSFPDNAPAVRYIRFKTLENWDKQGRGFTNIGQLTFWGYIQ